MRGNVICNPGPTFITQLRTWSTLSPICDFARRKVNGSVLIKLGMSL